MSTHMYRRAIDLLEAQLGDELVALDPSAGHCFGFNEVATWVWQRLAQPATFNQLRDGLLEEFDVEPAQCSDELQELLEDLSAKGW